MTTLTPEMQAVIDKMDTVNVDLANKKVKFMAATEPAKITKQMAGN